MRIIDQSVTVLDPLTMDEGIRQLRLCEYAGRKCYDSMDRITDDSYVRFLTNAIERGHTSILEHGKVSLDVVTSRDVLAQITRHRTGIGFSVQSQRYVKADKESGGIAYIQPHFFVPYTEYTEENADAWNASRAWALSCEETEEKYCFLLHNCNQPPEDARKVLDNSVATTFVVTMNFRELLHVYNLRSSPRAYPEMRILMQKMIDALTPVLPPIWMWGNYKEDTTK